MVQNVGENKSCGKPRKKKPFGTTYFFNFPKMGCLKELNKAVVGVGMGVGVGKRKFKRDVL